MVDQANKYRAKEQEINLMLYSTLAIFRIGYCKGAVFSCL